jgi:hypothetical protein
MTVGLVGTKLEPHAPAHSLTSDAQAVQAPFSPPSQIATQRNCLPDLAAL